MTVYLVTKSGLGIEIEISESELEKLKEQLAKGDVVDSIDE